MEENTLKDFGVFVLNVVFLTTKMLILKLNHQIN